MATRTSPTSNFLDHLARRFQRELAHTWRRTFTRGDLLALLVVTALLLMPVLAMRSAGWAEELGVLVPIALMGIVVSFFLSRSQFGELSALIIHAAYGILLILAVQAIALDSPGSVSSRADEIFERIGTWYRIVSEGGASDDNLIPVVFLSILYWFLVLNTVWHIFRLDRVWMAVIPPALALIVNNTNYVGHAHADLYLGAYLFFAIVLIAHSHMRTREYEWYRNQVRYPRQVRDVVIRIGIVMAMFIMLFGWVVPAGSDNDNWEKFQDFIGSDPLKELSDLWNRLFSSLEGEGIATADYYGGERLDLSGPIQLGDDPVMRVDLQGDFTPNRLYWRSTAFDTYINGSWTHRREVRAFKDSSGMTFAIGNFEARRNLVQEFTMDIAASSLVYAAPQPVELGLPVEAELNCVDGGGSSCVNDGKQTDVAVIRARETLRKGDQYEVTSSVSTATADQLRQAGSDYPEWVTYSYLQGGDDISFNLRGLTQQIIQFNAAQSNYDKAKAIEQWLRTNIAYNELIPAPPSDRDPLDWFVFDIREGYCNYYATAMVMMLRSEGIPARMAAGFAEGDYDPNTGIYTVIERDAHTWVEVYFPGYGWIEFEPTSDEEQLERAGDNVFSDDFPTLTPIPSPTPTILPTNTPPPVAPTPTATLTPTATPQGTPPSQQTETPQPTSTPTITPSPTITPTSTQGPEQQTPITDVEADDDGGNFWQTVLLILMIILIPLAILTLIGLFMIWWVEYRGLGGLTPIQRAYARMGIYGRWLGADINTLLTPDEQRRRLVEEVPDGREPINTITGLYTEERFAPPRRDDGLASRGETRAKRSWTLARKAFIVEKINRWLGRV